MWQADTFDPKRINQELGWAQALGMNTMRVFLHDLLWQQDPQGFKRRIGQFLDIAASHGIRPVFVLFDWCWDTQPHHDDWSPGAPLTAIESIQLGESDIISFHDYSWPEKFAARVAQLRKYGRPLICTEYMARGAGSTIDNSLPIAKQWDVGMINWGFVLGKTQTNFPWDSWQHPYTSQPPVVWHHDLLRPDGTRYGQREAEILRTVSSLPKGVVASGH